MLRRIRSKYNGKCRSCGNRFSAGDWIYWSHETKALCETCGAVGKKETVTEKRETVEVRNTDLGQPWIRGNESFYTVDWSDFKERCKAAAFNGETVLNIRANESHTLRHFQGGSWHGYSEGQIKRWLTEGFQTDAIKGLGEFIPPVREKRRLQFLEEGDEFHLDLAWSGSDEYMSRWTKRESIPGVALEIGLMFSSAVSAETINAYNAWLCKVVYSLESSGVDCEVTMDFPSWNMFGSGHHAGSGQLQHSIVRVKKENEITDFLSWSAMLSPAALRVFGFNAMIEHADASGKEAKGSLGRGVPERRDWQIVYDAERRVIVVENDYMSRGNRFPEEKLTAQLRDVLKQISS